MKKLLFLTIGIFCLFSFTTSNQASVSFYPGSLSDMKARAVISNRPYFVNFYTEWCGPCRNMKKYTFTEPKLAAYIKDNYLAFNVDAEGLTGDGIEVAQRYNVVSYPTIILFSADGKVLHRLQGYQSAQGLLTELQKYKTVKVTKESDIKEFSAPPSVPNKDIEIDLTSGSTPTTNPSPSFTEPIEIDVRPTPPVTQPVNRPSTTTSSPTPTFVPPATTSRGLFKVNVSSQASIGYGVQMGVFGDYANVLKEIQKLDGKGISNVLVNVNQLEGKTVFKVIVGPYSTKPLASTKKETLKTSENINGMVVDLARF